MGETEHNLGAGRTPVGPTPELWRWTSDSIAPHERVSQWHDVHARAIARRTITTEAEEFGRVEVDLVRLGAGACTVGLQRMRIEDASEARRDRSLLQDGSSDIVLHLQSKGTRSVEQLGRSAETPPGGAVFSVNAEQSCIRLTGGADFVSIALPRAALCALVPNVEDAAARPVAPDLPTLRLLHAFLGGIDFVSVAGDRHLGALVAGHLLDLAAHLAGGLGAGTVETARKGIAAARLAAIKADVRQGLNGDLAVETLARRHGISTRYLHRLFERDGTTLSRHVTGLRLEVLRRALVDSANRGRTVADLVYAAGFNDLSTCNRAFKAQYGISPGAMRRTPPDNAG